MSPVIRNSPRNQFSLPAPERERLQDLRLDSRPVVDDLFIVDPENGVSAEVKLSVVRDVFTALRCVSVVAISVDLNHESLAHKKIHPMTEKARLRDDAYAKRFETNTDESFEPRIGEPGYAISERTRSCARPGCRRDRMRGHDAQAES